MFNKQKKFEEAVLSGEYSNDDIKYSSYYKDSFKRLKKNKMAMLCAIIILLLVIIAVLHRYWRPMTRMCRIMPIF